MEGRGAIELEDSFFVGIASDSDRDEELACRSQ